MDAQHIMTALELLVVEFRSHLDESVIVAIAEDHDLNDQVAFHSVRDILRQIAMHAEGEQDAVASHRSSHNESRTGPTVHQGSRSGSPSNEEDSDSSERSSWTSTPPDEDDGEAIPRIDSFDDATEEAKTAQLESMFTDMRKDQIIGAIRGAHGEFHQAMDDLLTLQYVSSIEASSQVSDTLPSDGDDGPQSFRGRATETADEQAVREVREIAYISERLGVPYGVASESYFEHGRSQAAAILAILDHFIWEGVETRDEVEKFQAAKIKNKYKHIPETYATAIVHIAGTDQYWDVARVLNKYFKRNPPWAGFDYTLKPSEDEIEGDFSEAGPSTSTAARPAPIFKTGPQTYKEAAERALLLQQSARPKTYKEAAERALHLKQPASPTIKKPQGKAAHPSAHKQPRRNVATPTPNLRAPPKTAQDALRIASEAEDARRRARNLATKASRPYLSHRYTKTVAAIYAHRAEAYAAEARQAHAVAADLLVAERRTPLKIDLHGVFVTDGVRIALAEVRKWWDSPLAEGETRAQRGARPFEVVTGAGNHSAVTGVSKLRKAVCAALVKDGWKLICYNGCFEITGRA